jgi:hypothetical protein
MQCSDYTIQNLPLVRLISIALDSLDTAMLALDLVLVGALLVEVNPLLAVVVTSLAMLGPCCLFRGHHKVHNITRGIFGVGEAVGGSQRHNGRGSES